MFDSWRPQPIRFARSPGQYWRNNLEILKCLLLSLLIAFALGCAGYYEEEKRTPGEFVDDTLISTTVKRLLISDPEIKGIRIKVRVRQGVVTLSGISTSSYAVDKAIGIAETVNGVKGVQNKLTIAE